MKRAVIVKGQLIYNLESIAEMLALGKISKNEAEDAERRLRKAVDTIMDYDIPNITMIQF